jgi:hypothetical protein
MTTATDSPLTEEEVRSAISAALEASSIDIGEWVHDLCRPLHWSPTELRGENYRDGLWVDLRESEAAALEALVDQVYEHADAIQAEAVKRIGELVLYAAMEFAQTHPDAPRPAREAVPA